MNLNSYHERAYSEPPQQEFKTNNSTHNLVEPQQNWSNLVAGPNNNSQVNSSHNNISVISNYQQQQQHFNVAKKNPTSQMNNKKQYSFSLQHVYGISCASNQSLAFNPQNGELSYPAGSMIVHYNVSSNKQTKYFNSMNRKSIISLAYSPDGKFLASGQSTGQTPEIGLWDLQETNIAKDCIQGYPDVTTHPTQQLRGHQFGIDKLLFSPNSKYLVSIGDDHDRGLFVWDYINEMKLTTNKMSKQCQSACFSQNSRIFVTVGVQMVKFWYFDEEGTIIMTTPKQRDDTFIMQGQNAILGSKFEEKTFVDCKFADSDGDNRLFTLSQDGILCLIGETRTVDQWLDLQVNRAFSLAVQINMIICGCSDGVIRVFKTQNLQHLTTLPQLPALYNYNVEKGVTKLNPSRQTDVYSDCVSLVFDKNNMRLATIYSDRTLFIWDFQKLDQILVQRSFLNHSAGIVDLQLISSLSTQQVSFVASCSPDQTVKIWHFCDDENGGFTVANNEMPSAVGLRRNVYSKNLNKIIYLDKQEDPQIYKDLGHKGKNENLDDEDYRGEIADQKATQCFQFSTDAQYLAVGDFEGQVRIFSMQNFEYLLTLENPHSQEITAIDFCTNFIATGSRDRAIHVYSIDENFQFLLRIDDHSSSILQIKFCFSKENQKLHLVSGAADQSLIFREYVTPKQTNNIRSPIPGKNQQFMQPQSNLFTNQPSFRIVHQEIDQSNKIFSLDIDAESGLTYVGEQRKIITLSAISSQKEPNRQFEIKQEDQNSGKMLTLDCLQVTLDPSGSFLAVYCSDRAVRVINLASGSVVAKMNPGDVTTGMVFSMNGKHLITSNSCGCIFVWKVASEIQIHMEKKQTQIGLSFPTLKDFYSSVSESSQQEWVLRSFWQTEELKNFISKKAMKHIQSQSLIPNKSLSFQPPFEGNHNKTKSDIEKIDKQNKQNSSIEANSLLKEAILSQVPGSENTIDPKNLIQNTLLPDWAKTKYEEKKTDEIPVVSQKQQASKVIQQETNDINQSHIPTQNPILQKFQTLAEERIRQQNQKSEENAYQEYIEGQFHQLEQKLLENSPPLQHEDAGGHQNNYTNVIKFSPLSEDDLDESQEVASNRQQEAETQFNPKLVQDRKFNRKEEPDFNDFGRGANLDKIFNQEELKNALNQINSNMQAVENKIQNDTSSKNLYLLAQQQKLFQSKANQTPSRQDTQESSDKKQIQESFVEQVVQNDQPPQATTYSYTPKHGASNLELKNFSIEKKIQEVRNILFKKSSTPLNEAKTYEIPKQGSLTPQGISNRVEMAFNSKNNSDDANKENSEKPFQSTFKFFDQQQDIAAKKPFQSQWSSTQRREGCEDDDDVFKYSVNDESQYFGETKDFEQKGSSNDRKEDQLQRIDKMLEVQQILNEMDEVKSQACRPDGDDFKQQKQSFYQELINDVHIQPKEKFTKSQITLAWPQDGKDQIDSFQNQKLQLEPEQLNLNQNQLNHNFSQTPTNPHQNLINPTSNLYNYNNVVESVSQYQNFYSNRESDNTKNQLSSVDNEIEKSSVNRYEESMKNSFALIFNEISNLQNLMFKVQTQQQDVTQSRVIQQFSQNMAKTKDELTNLNLRASQINTSHSIVSNTSRESNRKSNIFLNQMIIGASRDLIDNYSQILLNTIKSTMEQKQV